MPSIDIDVSCHVCGSDLDATLDIGRGGVYITVRPCEICLEAANDEGVISGYDDGHTAGYAEGHDDGYDEGLKDGEG